MTVGGKRGNGPYIQVAILETLNVEADGGICLDYFVKLEFVC